jgi:hypothetical protein
MLDPCLIVSDDPSVRRWWRASPYHGVGSSRTNEAVHRWLHDRRLRHRKLQRGAFHSLVDLQAAINRYLAEHNHHPNPSSGPPTPTASSKTSNEGTKRRRQPTKTAHAPESLSSHSRLVGAFHQRQSAHFANGVVWDGSLCHRISVGTNLGVIAFLPSPQVMSRVVV